MRPPGLNWYEIGERLFYTIWVVGNLVVAGVAALTQLTWICLGVGIGWNAFMLKIDYDRRRPLR